MKKLTLFILLTFIINYYPNFAQSGKVLLVQGKISDKNGKNVSTIVSFTPPDGKPVNSKTNSGDGSYQVVLMPGITYTVSFKDYIVPNDQSIYTTPSVNQYTELSKDFRIIKIEEGMELFSFNGFDTNSIDINSECTKHFKLLKDFLISNQKASISFIVSSNDSYFKPSTKKIEEVVKGKKKVKTIKVSEEEQLSELLDKRINKVKFYLEQINIPTRKITFNKNIIAGSLKSAIKAKSGKKSKPILKEEPKSDIIIKVDKIANL